MTLLLAASLGNVLAWCVHAFTWWLRERYLGLIAVLGTPAALLYFIVWPMSIISAQQGWWFLNPVLFAAIFIASIFAPIMLGLWHSKILQNQDWNKRLQIILALYFETTLLSLVCAFGGEIINNYRIEFFFTDQRIGNNHFGTKAIVVASCMLTFLFGALFRKQIINFVHSVRELG